VILVDTIRDVLSFVVVITLSSAAILCLLAAARERLIRVCVRRHLVSTTGVALLVFAFGLTTTVAKRTGTTGVSPVEWTAAETAAPHMASRHSGGGVRSGASNADFWLSSIDPSSNSVELGVAWLPGAFAAPPFIEFTVSTNLSFGAWTLLGWTEAEAGETNLSVEVVASQLPGGAMPPAAFFRAMAYDGLGADYDDDDGDDLTNAEERALGTNPRRADSDGDGIPDGEEAAYGRYGAPLPVFDLSSVTNCFSQTTQNGTYPAYAVVPLPFAVELAGGRSTNVVVHFVGIAEFLAEGAIPSGSGTLFRNPDVVYATGNAAVAAYGYMFWVMASAGSELRAGVVPGTQGRWFVAEWRDMLDPMGFVNLTMDVGTFQVAVCEAEPSTVHVRYISLDQGLDGTSAIVGAHGFGGDPDLLVSDGASGSVTNGMTISYHFGTGTDPANPDSDGDGLPDGWETAYGMDPLASNTGDPRTDASADPDLDGLTNAQEAALGTDPFQPDSDGDGMDDGWESRHGFDPTTHNDDTARDDDDADADPDNDGLTNAEECAWGTNPSGADEDGDGFPDGLDTDRDGVNDGVEIAQNSDPADPTDEGQPNSRTPVSFYFGDHSSSCSEKYRLTVSPVPVAGETNPPRTFSWVNARYDQCETRTAMLTPGHSYEVRLAHASTNRSQGPDYDYTLNAVNVPLSVIVSDPDGLFGVHSSGSTFTGEGLVATIHVLAPPQISAPKVIGVNNDDDNGNGTSDDDDEGGLVGDDDIVGVTVSATCPSGMSGTVTVRKFLVPIIAKLWKDSARTQEMGATETITVAGGDTATLTYYLEGVGTSSTYMDSLIRATFSCGGVTITNEHRFTVVERIAEPITTVREGGQVVNPCCAVIGAATPMKVQVLPSNFPDSEIKWKIVSGSGTFANGGTGRSVSFTATGPENSETKLQVDVGDCPGRAPQFTLRGTTMHEVKIYPCVIHFKDEESPITQPLLDSMLVEVNAIFRQVGIHFIYGAPILNITNTIWAEKGFVDFSVGNQIRNIMRDTDGVEVYFIPGESTGILRKKRKMGTWTRRGIIVRNSANAKTLAHEIGHACGLCDIFIDHGNTEPSFVLENVKREWMPDDWNNGTGCRFYDPILQHKNIIHRLLMFGNSNETKSDIPWGFVRGLSEDGESGDMSVGRGWMTLSPRSL
jgi:hypothetical protein